MNYYNEFDKCAANWLRNLIAAGLLPAGDVDERSIVEVMPGDLTEYTQCHFFAGIGGWPLALQLAGWPADRHVWTGSCPCQPYSAAGKRLGDADDRNLWPVFFNLIRQCRPVAVFGEQVASAIGHGWLDGISTDLETEGYACGAVVLGAHSVSAPHIRQRLFWVADSDQGQRGRLATGEGSQHDRAQAEREQGNGVAEYGGAGGRMADGLGQGLEGFGGHVNNGVQPGRIDTQQIGSTAAGGSDCWLPNANSDGRDQTRGGVATTGSHGPIGNGWGDDWINCADGKARRIEPGLSPLAHGIPARVVRLRGYGNAIVPQVAAEFIAAYMGL